MLNEIGYEDKSEEGIEKQKKFKRFFKTWYYMVTTGWKSIKKEIKFCTVSIFEINL